MLSTTSIKDDHLLTFSKQTTYSYRTAADDIGELKDGEIILALGETKCNGRLSSVFLQKSGLKVNIQPSGVFFFPLFPLCQLREVFRFCILATKQRR